MNLETLNLETLYDLAFIWGNFQSKKVDVYFKRLVHILETPSWYETVNRIIDEAFCG